MVTGVGARAVAARVAEERAAEAMERAAVATAAATAAGACRRKIRCSRRSPCTLRRYNRCKGRSTIGRNCGHHHHHHHHHHRKASRICCPHAHGSTYARAPQLVAWQAKDLLHRTNRRMPCRTGDPAPHNARAASTHASIGMVRGASRWPCPLFPPLTHPPPPLPPFLLLPSARLRSWPRWPLPRCEPPASDRGPEPSLLRAISAAPPAVRTPHPTRTVRSRTPHAPHTLPTPRTAIEPPCVPS